MWPLGQKATEPNCHYWRCCASDMCYFAIYYEWGTAAGLCYQKKGSVCWWLHSHIRLNLVYEKYWPFDPFLCRLVVPTVFLLYFGIGQFIFSENYGVLCCKKLLKHYNCCFLSHVAIFDVVGELGSTHLYCSSMDLIETVSSPTFFCSFQGKEI